MKYFALVSVCLLGVVLGTKAQGPVTQGSETVSKKKQPAVPDPDATTDPNAPAAPAPATTVDPNAAPIPSKYKPNKDGLPQGVPTFSSDVLTVTLDVSVLDNKGNPIPKIPQSNFRVLEDNTPQKVTGFSVGEAPMTICLLIGVLKQGYFFGHAAGRQVWADGQRSVVVHASHLAAGRLPGHHQVRSCGRTILTDFSTDRQQTMAALQELNLPPIFLETNMYDALAFTGERMQNIEGRKAIVLVSSGVDSFSKLNYDKARKVVQDNGIPIYGIGISQAQREMSEARMGPIQNLDVAMSNNIMKTLSTETGGRAFFPMMEGEMPGVFRAVQEAMRSSYVLTYQPTNQTKDGKFRRLKVELVNSDNQPMKVVDEKGKPLKIQIVAKAGYKAPREVE